MTLKILTRVMTNNRDLGWGEDDAADASYSGKLAVNPAHVVGVMSTDDGDNNGSESIVFLAHRPKGYRVLGSVEQVVATLEG